MLGQEYLRPKNFKDPLHLFRIVVNNVISLNRNDFQTHAQWASILFGKGDDVNQGYLSIVTNNFGTYLKRENGVQSYAFDMEKIREDFPKWFHPNLHFDILDEIRLALKKEKQAALMQRTGRIFDIIEFNTLGEHEEYFLYEIYIDMESDPSFILTEGMRVRLGFHRHRFWAEVLFFDDLEFKLIVRSRKKIERSIYENTFRRRLAISAGWLIDHLSACFEDYPKDNELINRLFSDDLRPSKVESPDIDIYYGILDKSQKNALKNILKKDISALWGPPGTGKTTTIAYLLMNLFRSEEKTLVCSIANVAVDALLEKLVRTFEEYEDNCNPIAFREEGRLLRVGFISRKKLKDKNYLKLQDAETKNLRWKLKKIKQKLKDDNLTSEQRARLESDKLDKQQEIEKHKAGLLWKAQMIFSTASKFTIDKALQAIEFDNLVIDEASMMSVPYLLALAKKVKKRIIIAGDFMQLGPIAVSSSYFSHLWLKKDLFHFFGIDKYAEEIQHPSLSMITNQRRFHKSICDLINSNFYRDQLNTKTEYASLKLLRRDPHKESVIIYKDLSSHEEFLTKRNREQSRFNLYSAEYITRYILAPIFENPPMLDPFNIAIITPYRAQVALIKKTIKAHFTDKAFTERIQVGTVHSFQGSEADLLIFDLVDAKNIKVGRLFWQEEGERLTNVAISRATGKLIVVGHIKAITYGQSSNNLSLRTRSTLQALEKYKLPTS